MAPEAAQAEVKAQVGGMGMGGALAWPAPLRQLDRQIPGYDA